MGGDPIQNEAPLRLRLSNTLGTAIRGVFSAERAGQIVDDTVFFPAD
jgi:hypothetical protein